jgi:quercetin dioxygenase-like cupin family protein
MVRVPATASALAPPDRFTGSVWVGGITEGVGRGHARLAIVHFSPGARTAWHRHARGQTLRVTEGVGLVSSRDGEVIVMRPGDTVYTRGGVWHWHGAVADRFMSHLAMADSCADADGADVEWGAHVTDEEYAAATASGGAE